MLSIANQQFHQIFSQLSFKVNEHEKMQSAFGHLKIGVNWLII